MEAAGSDAGMVCWIVIAGGKLQSFARPSYRIAVAGDVFHALDGGPGDRPGLRA
jgi:hypothetical protein